MHSEMSENLRKELLRACNETMARSGIKPKEPPMPNEKTTDASGPYVIEQQGEDAFAVCGPTLHHYFPRSYVDASNLQDTLNAAYAAGHAAALTSVAATNVPVIQCCTPRPEMNAYLDNCVASVAPLTRNAEPSEVYIKLWAAMKLISVQDQGCGGNITDAEAWKSAQAIALQALRTAELPALSHAERQEGKNANE